MPIDGLSDKTRYSRAGMLRLGEKTANDKGKEYPRALGYFRPDFEDTSLNEWFWKKYGEQPKQIEVVFPTEDREIIWSQYYCFYGSGSGLKCKGTGSTCQRRMGDNDFKEMDCPGPDTCKFSGMDNYGKPNCKRLARLSFILPELPTLQIVQIATGSINAIININSCLKMMEDMLGQIRGRIVVLTIRDIVAIVNGKKTNNFAMDLSIPHSFRGILEGKAEEAVAKALPAPEDIPEDKEERPKDIFPEGINGDKPTPDPEVMALFRKTVTLAENIGGADDVKARLKANGFSSIAMVSVEAIESVLLDVSDEAKVAEGKALADRRARGGDEEEGEIGAPPMDPDFADEAPIDIGDNRDMGDELNEDSPPVEIMDADDLGGIEL